MEKIPAIYILANRPDGVLYVGVTSDLAGRMFQHKSKMLRGFAAKYNVDKLVYYEVFGEMYDAISREKQLKGGSRQKKIELIESSNPGWEDLYGEILG